MMKKGGKIGFKLEVNRQRKQKTKKVKAKQKE